MIDQVKILQDFPEFFPGIFGDPSETCLAFGLEIGNGWYPLVYKLCEDIKALPEEDRQGFEFVQVKEKWGGLRAYSQGSSSKVDYLINKAEEDSFKTCEGCGTTDNVTSEGSWITTLCTTCRNKRNG